MNFEANIHQMFVIEKSATVEQKCRFLRITKLKRKESAIISQICAFNFCLWICDNAQSISDISFFIITSVNRFYLHVVVDSLKIKGFELLPVCKDGDSVCAGTGVVRGVRDGHQA